MRGYRSHPLMEPKKSNTIITNNNTIVANEADDDNKNKMKIKDHHRHQAGTPKPMKKRGAMHLIRVAFYMLRRKSKTSMHVDLASKVLGSMRPLHLHGNNNDNNNNNQRQQRPSKDIETRVAAPMIEQTSSSVSEEVFTPPVSPAAPKSIASSSSVGSLSQYASATNLQELDACEEEDEDDDNDDDNGGDEMIDAKAEEFINQFYEQMRIQNFEYMNSHKQMKLKRADI